MTRTPFWPAITRPAGPADARRMIKVARDNPARPDVRRLLEEHLADMFATSPAESVHALDPGALAGPDITFWTARDGAVPGGEALLGCAALKDLGAEEGEIKSM